MGNVIGCFLGRNLTRVRHGSEMYERLQIAMSPSMVLKKKFSPDEDRIILDEVAKNGNTISTWKTLTKKLNRGEKYTKSYCNSIRSRYFRLLNSATYSKGNWTLEEESSLLEHLF